MPITVSHGAYDFNFDSFFSQREPSKRGHKSPEEYYRAQGYPDPEVGQLFILGYIYN
jgi:hypothetical protein